MNSIGAAIKLSSLSNNFVSQLYLARSEAIKRNGHVVICKSADGATCSVDGGWEHGWIVFHDTNNNGLREVGESLIQRGEALPDGYRLAGNQNVGHYISFNPVGITQLSSGAFQAGTLTLCPPSSDHVDARQVVINTAGRPRIQKTTVESCA
jgi:type IV fimbrial biogenesis protein FimT